MKPSDILLYPFSQAQYHFKQAEHSNWLEWSVHYAVGTLEYIPVLNYLVVLVDVVVRAFFSRCHYPTPPVVRTLSLVPLGWKAEGFLAEHQITLESPLIKKIEGIQGIQDDQAAWKESDSSAAWVGRIRPLKTAIQELLSLVEESTELKQIETNLGSNTTSIFAEFQSFQKVMNTLLQTEKERRVQVLQELQSAFAQFKAPVINSVEDFLLALGFSTTDEFRSYYSMPVTILKKWGLQTLQDIDRLELRSWDTDLLTLEHFQPLLKYEYADVTQAYQTFLIALKDKLKKVLVNEIGGIEMLDTPVNQFINSTDPISKLVDTFRALVTLRQKELLKAYLKQDRCGAVWVSIKESSPQMTLEGYCTLHKGRINDVGTLYKLGIFHFETLQE